jgi:hypothetical protein
MADSTFPDGIINQKHFDRYAAKWLSVLSSRHHKKLRHSFQPTHDKSSRVRRVTFSLEHIIYLISSVGASHIQARFLLMEAQEGKSGRDEAAAGQDRFTVALYATNAQGERVSAYYVSNEAISIYRPHHHDALLASQETSASQPATANSLGEQPQPAQDERPKEIIPVDDAVVIPNLVVQEWLEYWADAREITPEMFRTSYGPLQGYTFSLGDFRDPLFEALPWPHGRKNHYKDHYNLRVDFALHKYYPAVGESCEPTLTFGLVLQLQELKRIWPEPVPGEYHSGEFELPAVTDEEISDPFFDMSMPCPPNH